MTKHWKQKLGIAITASLICSATADPQRTQQTPTPISVSGIYPSLAYYNNEGECGTGAVVPWVGKLWVITYGPHLPFGSSDKLYAITPEYQQIVFKESIGGTPANRMIHPESDQLFIGPYSIDANANVRVIRWQDTPGRYTGMARHLTDPKHKLYLATMEEGLYELDVQTLKTTELYRDNNVNENNLSNTTLSKTAKRANLFGVHGKGLYSGQGVVVYSNNGEDSPEATTNPNIESGSLSEWDGERWQLIRRNQFTEITGPGGIYGNNRPSTDPIWALGWDSKSVLLGVRTPKKGWGFYRLPKANHSYDGAHGWNTEWPRIRDIGIDKSDYLMTMHGMFWRFPATFTTENTYGIRPRSAFLKVIGDFARWNNQLVFGCDDSAKNEFLNKRAAKGNIKGPGQSNSNVWFTSILTPDQLGATTATGSVWENDDVKSETVSEPFLFSGWSQRCSWIKNSGSAPCTFTYEIDKKGNNRWHTLQTVFVDPGESVYVPFSPNEAGEWIRIKSNTNTVATAVFAYTDSLIHSAKSSSIFNGLIADVDNLPNSNSIYGGLLYSLGDNRRALGVLANNFADGTETGYYELDEKLVLQKKDDQKTADFIRTKFAIPHHVVKIESGSILIVDDQKRRWRLPLNQSYFDKLTDNAQLRICREVATERDLFHCHGTFYELPAENADGYAKIRPIATSPFLIQDYASYRGMLVMTGIDTKTSLNNPHIIVSEDGKAAVWAGVIDDLWNLGKPTGHGGPLVDTAIQKDIPSEPYLIGFYDQKNLTISHQSPENIIFSVEVNPTGNGDWMQYGEYTVEPKKEFKHEFPPAFQARWIRFKTNKDTTATTWLVYK